MPVIKYINKDFDQTRSVSNEENTINMYTSHFNGWVYYTESFTYDFQKRVQRKSLHETIPASGFNI